MNVTIDKHMEMNTFIHALDPRAKFIGFMVLIFTFSFIKSLSLLPFIIFITASIFISSKISFAYLLKKWCLPSFFIVTMSLFLVFFSKGETLLSLGPLDIKLEGIIAMILIVIKFLCIFTIMITLFETTNFLTIIKVMDSLGLPSILTDMTMFTYRYLFELGENLNSMQIAMRMRGFKNTKLKDMVHLASLFGTILVRSYEKSERVYQAMVLRGYGNNHVFKEEFVATKKDKIFISLTIFLAISIIIGQVFLV